MPEILIVVVVLGMAAFALVLITTSEARSTRTRWRLRHPIGMVGMTKYESEIVATFKELCVKNGGASPAEVTMLMAARDQLAELDTPIDIADQMKDLRNRGLL